ncbi:glycosyltransferase family 4 protein [Candidatus Roizmanbacteria bacterium]|jgi:glycosyltransferase involved in cell wall biosynthesis|nr:glycosyltransferase family 4 protein [Candidatus Roizmanbacteria bacterium]
MSSNVYVYDPTVSDKQSRVRGVGRYLQIIKESFYNKFVFTDNLDTVPFDSIFINPFFNLTQPPLTKRRLAKKQIAVIHDLIPLKYKKHFPSGLKGKINIFFNKLSLKNYDSIITDSNASKKDIEYILKIKPEKINVVYPCLPKIFFAKPKDINNKPLSICNLKLETFSLYVGDASWNKNIVNLAKAIKLADIPCVFVGKVFENKNQTVKLSHPWQKSLKEFFSLVKDDRRFIFPGFITDDELIKLYKQAAVNILPSYDEGFGFSFVEAASQSCPSVLSNIAVLKETADDKALFVNPHQPESIIKAVQKLHNDINFRREIGFEAQQRSKYFNSFRFEKDLERCLS